VSDISIYWDTEREEERLVLGDGTVVYLAAETDRVLRVLWTLYEPQLDSSEDPWAYAPRALVDAQRETAS
jgi:hypothetical protein